MVGGDNSYNKVCSASAAEKETLIHILLPLFFVYSALFELRINHLARPDAEAMPEPARNLRLGVA